MHNHASGAEPDFMEMNAAAQAQAKFEMMFLQAVAETGQAELARLLGVDKSTISKYCTNAAGIPLKHIGLIIFHMQCVVTKKAEETQEMKALVCLAKKALEEWD